MTKQNTNTVANVAELAQSMTSEQRAELAAMLGIVVGGSPQRLTVKANPVKRTISLYGMQRMPITLYRGQWLRMGADPAKLPQLIELLGDENPLVIVAQFISAHEQYLPLSKGGETKKVPTNLIGEEGKPFRMPKPKQ